AAWPRLLRNLVEEVLPLRLIDRRGTLILGGTPGNVLQGPFWEWTDRPARVIRTVGNGRVAFARPYRERLLPKWQDVAVTVSLHTWTLAENTARPDIWLAMLEQKRAQDISDDNPIWRREALGEWVADHTNKLYRFEPARNTWTPDPEARTPFKLPEGHDWYYVIGVDFGYTDPLAIVTLAFSDSHPVLFQVA